MLQAQQASFDEKNSLYKRRPTV
jgi:hypothetical protein